MMLGTIVVFCLSIGTALYFFSGFLGGGRSWIGILQAFLLCFGIASVLYLPALVLFFMARHVRAYGAKAVIGIASVCISLPLWGAGGAALMLKQPYFPYALLIMGFGLLILWWGVLVLKSAQSRTAPLQE